MTQEQQNALTEAWQEQFNHCFEVLLEGLVEGDPRAAERFCQSVSWLDQARAVAAKVLRETK